MALDGIRSEIEHMRRQIARQQKDIQSLCRAGIDSSSAEDLLARMQDKVDRLVLQRDEMIGAERRKYAGTNKVINGTPAHRRA